MWQSKPEPVRFGRLGGRQVWHRVTLQYGTGEASLCGVSEHKQYWEIDDGSKGVPLALCKRCERIAAKEKA